MDSKAEEFSPPSSEPRMNRLLLVLFLANCMLCASSLINAFGSAIFPLSQPERSNIPLTNSHQPLRLWKLHGRLCIQRKDEQIVCIAGNGIQLAIKSIRACSDHPTDKYTISCEGIFGIYNLPAGYYLAIIKQAQSLPDIPIPGLKRIETIELVKIPSTDSSSRFQHGNLNHTQIAVHQKRAEEALLSAFKQHTFYFSTSEYDLTRTYQSNMLNTATNSNSISHTLHRTPTSFTSNATPQQTHTTDTTHYPTTDWSSIEEKYCWNLNSLSPFLEANTTSFLTPVVNAYIDTTNITHNSKQYRFTLISRRSRRRQGPR